LYLYYFTFVFYISFYMYSREKGKKRQEFDDLAHGKKDLAEGSKILLDTDLK